MFASDSTKGQLKDDKEPQEDDPRKTTERKKPTARERTNEQIQLQLNMKKLSKKELEIMELFWKNGAMTTSEIRESMPEPRPHINTVSTQVRMLESYGFLGHTKEGTGYRYHYLIEWQDYNNEFNGNPFMRCLKNSYLKAVSALVKDDKITVEELRDLIDIIESEK